jgi:uncharacterized protein (DUF1501 family)
MFAAAAYLGQRFEAFETTEPPHAADQGMRMPPNLVLPADIPLSRLRDRRALLRSLDAWRADQGRRAALEGSDANAQRAYQILTDQRLGSAFELSREPAVVRERYGGHRMGQGLLLARRLIEAGVTYVLVNFSVNNTWDTHGKNFQILKDRLLPPMDRAVSALLADLDQRGLLDDVLVMAISEMGRTPIVNKDAGRDHWPNAYTVMLAGGGLTRGQVVGSTTAHGERPGERPVAVADVLATVYHQLGIDPGTMLRDRENRPIPILPEASPVRELIA